MGNLKPEDAVKKRCLVYLENWQKLGIVIDFDDLSNLGRKATRYGWVMHTKKGKRDIIALFKHQRTLWVYLIECKAPKGGVWKDDQKEYARRFDGLDNAVYEVVSNPIQVNKTIESITMYQQNIIDNIDTGNL